jgi:DNA repair protein RecO
VRPLRTYRVSALVLRLRNLGEADRVLTLLTQEKGKLTAVAKGARRPRSKLASLQAFSLATLQLAAGKNLDTITQAIVRLPFLTLRTEVARFAYANYFAELAEAFSETRERSPQFFDLVVSAFSFLDRGAEIEPLARAYELRLLDLSGYAPQLDHCVQCGRPVGAARQRDDEVLQDEWGRASVKPTGGVHASNSSASRVTSRDETPPPLATAKSLRFAYSPALGGVICARCQADAQGILSVSDETRAYLLELRGLHGLADLPKITIELSVRGRKEAQAILRTHIEYHLDRTIRSLGMIAKIMKDSNKNLT